MFKSSVGGIFVQNGIRRVDQVCKILDEAPKNDKSLIISDELYNSTAEDVATALAYGTYKLWGKDYPGLILFSASHFSKLSSLVNDEDVAGLTKNWKIKEATFDEKGMPVWSRTIMPGVNEQNIAIDIARQAISNEDVSFQADKAFKKLYEKGGLDPDSEISKKAQKELNRLKDKYKKLRGEKKELSQKKESKTRAYRELEEKHRKLIKQFKFLKKESADMENKLTNCRNGISILEQENEDLKKKLLNLK
ncbi:MAG: hypothetical protein ABIA74_01920 [bacterium]